MDTTELELNEQRRNFWARKVDLVVGKERPEGVVENRVYNIKREIAHSVLACDRNTLTERAIINEIASDSNFWKILEDVRSSIND